MVRRPPSASHATNWPVSTCCASAARRSSPPDDDALGRHVRDRANVAGEVPRAARCAAEPRLEHRRGRAFAHVARSGVSVGDTTAATSGSAKNGTAAVSQFPAGRAFRAPGGRSTRPRRCPPTMRAPAVDSRAGRQQRDLRSRTRAAEHQERLVTPAKKALLALVRPQDAKPVEDGKRVQRARARRPATAARIR